jgi:hypothetical protein
MDPPSRTFTVTPDDPFAIELPFDPRAVFGRARPPVVVAVNGFCYRSTVAIMSGRTFVPFRASNREAAGIRPGDPFEVTLTLDTAPRTVEAPEDLRTAIEAAGAWERWTALSYTRQREQVDTIEGAKRPETRARRIANCVTALD